MDDFFKACKEGNLDEVETFITKGCDVNGTSQIFLSYGRTPLICAAGERRFADVSKKDSRQRTALHYAKRGHLKVVEVLLSKGAEINVEDENRCTSLMLAAERGHIDILLYLIDHDADVNKKDCRNRTALHYASDLKVVKALLSKGVEIDVEDEDCCTPLLLAAERRHYDILLHLIDHGADVHKKDGRERTALHYASERGDLKVVEALLSKGAKIHVEDGDRCTLLFLAVKNQKFAIMCHLIKAGANVKRLVDDFPGSGKGGYLGRDHLLHTLSYAINNNHIAEAGVLIANGVGIEGELYINPRRTGVLITRTALTWSAENGHDSLVRNLILQGVNIDYQDGNGRSALHFASSSNHIQCGILLVEAGADLRLVDRDSLTPLDLASKELKDAIIQTLSFNTKKTVCVIGNAYSGKSTLIASLQNENAKLLKKVRHRLFGVKNMNVQLVSNQYLSAVSDTETRCFLTLQVSTNTTVLTKCSWNPFLAKVGAL